MQQLINQIEQWAEDRNLIKGSTPQKQMLKLMEEFGELCGGIARNNPEMIKDAIGDCFVVTVILCKQLNIRVLENIDITELVSEFNAEKYDYTNTTEQLLEAVHNLGGNTLSISNNWKIREGYFDLFLMNLVLITLFNKLDFQDCIQHAYDQIKDRKGRMIDGVFVKAEDL